MGHKMVTDICTPENVSCKISDWVKAELSGSNRSINWLSKNSGVEMTSLLRSINQTREFKIQEVLKIAHALGKIPPPWNVIDNSEKQRRFIPLYGNVSSAVWRMKGSEMPIGIAPLEPINAGELSGLDQHCYFIETGSHRNQYAVCINTDSNLQNLSDGDVVVAEETVNVNFSDKKELARSVLRIAVKRDGRIALAPYDADDGDYEECCKGSSVKIAGLVVGFFHPLCKK
jgi:hypothetical protein